VPTDPGLFCPGGGFYVDPWKPVEKAVVTHAHADHAAPGCAAYLASPGTAALLRAKFGAGTPVTALGLAERVRLGDLWISLHPAGHILGSASVRLEPARGPVWVVTGDYRATPDPSAAPHCRTCEPYEPVRCDVLVTECTFGLPIYRWRPDAETFSAINGWWAGNAAEGRTSLLFGWALGKSQRLLEGVDAGIGPIGVHGAVERFNDAYRAQGVRLPAAPRATAEYAVALRGRGLVLAPPSADRSVWMRKFGEVSTAYATGWMQIRGTRRRRSADRGFALSDHSDWEGLLWAVRESGAQRVALTHGYTDPMARWLGALGLETWTIPTRWEGEIVETGQGTSTEPGSGPDADGEPGTPAGPSETSPDGAPAGGS